MLGYSADRCRYHWRTASPCFHENVAKRLYFCSMEIYIGGPIIRGQCDGVALKRDELHSDVTNHFRRGGFSNCKYYYLFCVLFLRK